ncbi:MAG: DUF1501 domain-containing protein [Planctomycetaceae bacterium]|nr:DUF1501 domain-containing protein [Planctomycetaceae bacterium]
MRNQINRRELLKIGMLGTGLTLSQWLRIQAAEQTQKEKRSAIFIFMEGAPSHQDTFDLKPNAPVEIRGAFQPIATSVPGVQICEQMPRLAERAKRFAVIRGVTHSVADHGLAKKYLLTGNKPSPTVSYPEYGSVVSHEHPSKSNLPTYVSIDEAFVGPGYLGAQYSALTAEKPRHGVTYKVRGVSLEEGLSVAKYRSQKELLEDLDLTFQGFEDLDDQVRGMDRFTEQAYDIISSPQTRAAFDLSQEKTTESDRFGKHEFGQSMLLAARLIEAGVHFVTVRLRPADFDFDTHSDNFPRLQRLLPPFDRGFAALLDRLEERGMLSTTAILACGEFGRTPKINPAGGRDHWARAMCAVMAGGDIQGGQAIGETDDTAAEPKAVGFSPDDLAASFYQNIGISPDREFHTNVGRPIRLLREGRPISELF